MTPTPPFWFAQRQCKSEPVDGLLKVTGPNLGEAFLYARKADGEKWQAGLRLAADATDVDTAPELPNEPAAWNAAFELYRRHVIT